MGGLEQRLWNVPSDGNTGLVAQMDQLVPSGGFASIGRKWLRKNGRRYCDGYICAPWKIRSVTQEVACARERHGNDRGASGGSSFECAQLKRTNTFVRGECAFRKNKD